MIALRFDMDFGDKRTGCVQGKESSTVGLLGNQFWYAVSRKYDWSLRIRNFVQFIDKNRALSLQIFDDMAIMNNFVAHIDRRAVFLERKFDDLDCAIDTSAKTARFTKKNFERRL